MNILCLDGGSSSLKFAYYATGDGTERRLLRGAAEGLGQSSTTFWLEGADGARRGHTAPNAAVDFATVLARVFKTIASSGDGEPAAIGHRIVFGGPDHVSPALATPELLEDLERFVPFDPMHLRSQLDLVHSVTAQAPETPQVLCFDTAFHHGMPAIAQRIALPRSVGPLIRRYGYHGLSFEYIMSVLGDGAGRRVLIAHLGSGASLAAVRDGRSLDTTMGFSPLGGLMMSTRPGDMDPGVLLYLVAAGKSASDLTELLTKQSGLMGVSESSPNMETLLLHVEDDPRAAEAIDLFVYQIVKHAGAMIAVLGGVDTVVFTGGIGEHASKIRALVADGLAHFGIRLDPSKNAADADVISHGDSAVAVRVIPTDESLMIARHVRSLLAKTAAK